MDEDSKPLALPGTSSEKNRAVEKGIGKDRVRRVPQPAGQKTAKQMNAKMGLSEPDTEMISDAIPDGIQRASVAQPDPLIRATRLFDKMPRHKRNAARQILDALDASELLPSDWTASEKSRRIEVLLGQSVVANKKIDKRLIEWARGEGLLVDVDRGTPWGNPYKLAREKDRDEVCDRYEEYFAGLPELHDRLGELRGRVLACWCYPKRCHAMHLCKLASPEKGDKGSCDTEGG